jgi:hypothetical protein
MEPAYLKRPHARIVIAKFGGPQNLVYQDLPEPEPKLGISFH